MGHARALLSLRTIEEMESQARIATKKRLSVRQLETRVRKPLEGKSEAKETFRQPVPQNGPTGPQALISGKRRSASEARWERKSRFQAMRRTER